MRQTTKLRLHKEHKRIPRMSSEEWGAFLIDVEGNGIIKPLDVLQDGTILDGRHRWEAAKKLKVKAVSVRVVSPKDAVDYMYRTAKQKRNLTRGQRGMLCRFSDDYDEMRNGLAAKRGRPKKGQVLDSLSKADRRTDAIIGRRWGVGRETVRHCDAIWDWEKDGTLDKGTCAAILAAEKTATKVYIETKQRAIRDEGEWQPRSFNIWPAFPIEDFQRKYPGQLPAELLRNVLHYTTEKGDGVVDVFAGGGNVGLVCKEMKRPCLSYDIAPKYKGITKHNARKPLPKEAHGAKLVFLDPPYWSQKKGEYSDDKDDLANLGLGHFHATLADIVQNAADVTVSGGFVVLIIGATQKDGRYHNHVTELLAYGYQGLRVDNVVAAAYPPTQYPPPSLTRARESKTMLNLYTNIVFWKKEA